MVLIMKWKGRLMIGALTGSVCFVLALFVVLTQQIGFNEKILKKDELSAGQSEQLKRSMDIYPGKLRDDMQSKFAGPDEVAGHRELQEKSKSTGDGDAAADRERDLELFLSEHRWLRDMDKKRLKMLETLLLKIYSNNKAINSLLEAGYLILNRTNPDKDDYFDFSSNRLNDVRYFLEEHGYLNKTSVSNDIPLDINMKSKAEKPKKKPKYTFVTQKELDILFSVKQRSFKLGVSLDVRNGRPIMPKKLILTKENLESDWDGKPLPSHWRDFYTKITHLEMFPDPKFDKTVDKIVSSLANQEIIAVENMDGGTQIKLLFYFKDGGKAVFKPMRVTRDKETDPDIFYWRDYERATSEVAAFHLDRALNMRRTSPCVSRVINITQEIWKLADRHLAKTIFVSPANNVCFYGDCKYYCDTGHPVCGNPDLIDGSICAWLPNVQRTRYRSPWRRSYSKSRLADWEEDDQYCDKIKLKDGFRTGRRLLDLMDLETFDFIMYNMDRHHYEFFQQYGNNSFIINLDNGRGFGTHSKDELSILAPVIQCCLFRYSMLQKLLQLHRGPKHLSDIMRDSLSKEAIHPVLSEEHYIAMDRRVNITLKTVAECVRRYGASKVVRDDGV